MTTRPEQPGGEAPKTRKAGDGGKTRVMTRDLEARIRCGTFGPGQKLPSLRKLMDSYGVSLNTARRSLQALACRGLVECRHGSGTFVAAAPPSFSLRYRIAAAAATCGINALNTCTGIALNGIMDSAPALGLEVIPHKIGFPEMSDRRLEEMAKECDALILLGGYDGILKRPRLPVPAVGVAMHHSCGGLFSVIELDPFRAAELTARYFRQRGLRHVTVVRHDRPVHRLREYLFAEAWRRYGELRVAEFPFPLPASFPADARGGESDGILFLCGQTALTAAAEYRAATGRELSADVAVLSMDGNPMFVDQPSRGFPNIAINLREAGIAAAEECLRRLRQPGSAARRIYLSPALYEGLD